MAEHDQRFDSFQQWVDKASSWLTGHPEYNDTEHSKSKPWRGHHFKAICFDAKGRLCRIGLDFQRARDDKAFPVRWIWPDQIGPRLLELEAALEGEKT